jgi:hypothetical protein
MIMAQRSDCADQRSLRVTAVGKLRPLPTIRPRNEALRQFPIRITRES